MEFTAKQLAGVLKGTVDGNPEAKATSFAKIEHGKPGQLCFFANPKYEEYVYTCKASILLVNKDFVPKQEVTPTMVRVENAYTAIAELLKYVATQKRTDRRHRGFRSSWFLTSKFGKKVYLGSHSYVGHHAVIGDYTKIFENDPFAKLDQTGVGKLMEMAIKLGKPVNPKLHVGICGEHGGDPSSVEFCHKIGLDYVSCSPFRVPIARLAAAQAAIANK